jgi:lipopolysaccharide/colanic/teichoic acid biosynthesis glycosyltransferase
VSDPAPSAAEDPRASSSGGEPADPRDRHAALRARMRAAGRDVGPDGPIARPGGSAIGDLVRRGFDVVASVLALGVLALPLGLVLLIVRLESPGHPVFRQRRVGRDGREFDVLKVRTMVQGAETMGAGLAIVRGDSRITRLGRFLRRSSIDELPQLVNVLRGEMAIVGPRPTVPAQVAAYDDRQRERLLVRPGLTGWAQIQGRATLSWPERIEFDRWYVAHRSLRLDLRILLATVRVVLGGAGVERDGAAWDAPDDER